MMIQRRKILTFISILSFAGVLVTTYLITQHFGESGASFCNVSDYVSCDVVNKSRYSKLFGIPVSILGWATYIILTIVSVGLIKGVRFERIFSFLKPRFLEMFLLLFSGFGFLFSLYLSYIEFFVLHALCVFCLTQQFIIFFIFLISIFLWRQKRKAF
jgi:uncharacterized membrane protein